MTTPALHAEQHAQRQHWIGLALAITGAIFFSGKAIVAKLMYRYHVDAVLVISLRMLLAFPFFAGMAWWQARKQPALSKADSLRVVALGFLGYYLSSMLDFMGLQYITAGLERLILFLTPSFVLLMTAVFLKRHITTRQWLAMTVAYAGIFLVFAHDLNQGGQQVWLGAGLVFGAAVSYATYLLGSGELLQRVGSMRLVAYAMCVSSFICLIQFILIRPMSALIQPAPVWGLSLFNAVFCTILPVVMTMMAIARIGAPSASQAGMIGPVSTILLGALMLGEPITLWQLAGSGLVMVGIAVLGKR